MRKEKEGIKGMALKIIHWLCLTLNLQQLCFYESQYVTCGGHNAGLVVVAIRDLWWSHSSHNARIVEATMSDQCSYHS